LILAKVEMGVRRALAEANGGPPLDRPLLPGGLFLVQVLGDGRRQATYIQTYMPRTELTVP
jgi:hypothetical protein